MTKTDDKVSIIYILGAGHCGSTLLSLLLNENSLVISVSELVTLNRDQVGYAGHESLLDLKFWRKVSKILATNYTTQLGAVRFADLLNCGNLEQQHFHLLQSIKVASGKKFICDASKVPEICRAYLRADSVTVKVIYLTRDPVAIVNSYYKKYKKWLLPAFKILRTEKFAKKLFTDPMAMSNIYLLRYEDLSAQPSRELVKLCDWLELPYELKMLQPEIRNFIGLGGNRMKNKEFKDITLDLEWKKELPIFYQLFTKIFFWRLRKKYGYY